MLPEVLIQTSLSDISVFLLSAPGLHPRNIPVGCGGGRIKLHFTEAEWCTRQIQTSLRQECQPTKPLTPDYVAALQLSLFDLSLKSQPHYLRNLLQTPPAGQDEVLIKTDHQDSVFIYIISGLYLSTKTPLTDTVTAVEVFELSYNGKQVTN